MFDRSDQTGNLGQASNGRNVSLQEDHPHLLAMQDSQINQNRSFNNIERHHNSLEDISQQRNNNGSHIDDIVQSLHESSRDLDLQPFNVDLPAAEVVVNSFEQIHPSVRTLQDKIQDIQNRL